MLHWLGEHYLLGNVLGLSSPRSFGADKTRYFLETDRAVADDLYTLPRDELPRYVARLQTDGYPYDALLIGTGGFFVDNSPPDDRWCQVIARWNAEYDGDGIRLRTATLGDWYDALVARDPGDWPVRRLAWPDGWAHGLGASAARIAQARRTQRRRADVVAMVEESGSAVAAGYLLTALEQEGLALEHTFSAWSTTARPASSANDFQHAAKELTFHRAELYLDDAAAAALRAIRPSLAQTPRLYARFIAAEGSRLVHFDAGDQRLDPASQVLVAADDRRLVFQADQPGLPRFVAALPAPPEAGVAEYRLAEDAGSTVAATMTTDVAASHLALANDGWSLTIDPTIGGLRSLRERSNGREWVESGQWAFGQLMHEAVVHPLGRAAVGNLARLVALGIAGDELRAHLGDGPVVERTAVDVVGPANVVHGPVFDAVALPAGNAALGRVTFTWRVYHALPIAELVLDWDKRWSDAPEAAYVVFPFAAAAGELRLETAGGFFRPGSHDVGGQLPGTCSSYYTVQRGSARRGSRPPTAPRSSGCRSTRPS